MTNLTLCPAQATARDALRAGLAITPVAALSGDPGCGKTTILRDLHREIGGAFLSIRDVVDAGSTRHPLSLEEALFDVVLAALMQNDAVIVDDFHVLYDAFCCNHFYPRSGWVEGPVTALLTYAIETGKKLVLSHSGRLPAAAQQRCFRAHIPRFRVEDYASLVGADLEFEKIYRFAPKLNAYQLKSACDWLRPTGAMTTESFIEYLRSQRLASNVDLDEVQDVDLRDLIGVDDVIRSLEISIALPLESDRLAADLNLRPKRGVLLYGPPGTGKTTVGRAFAHRLKGKFFRIDGTFIAGTDNFYHAVNSVFQAAKDNAPAVIFIDDADAIFEDGGERGLYRYLLTMLDGLESESAGRVCVMLTAMDLNHLPSALVRSGRVELWLEMKLPDEAARRSILGRHLTGLDEVFPSLDYDDLVARTDGFTGADLKRVVEDAKGLYAFARVNGGANADFLSEAIEGVVVNRTRFAQASTSLARSSSAAPQASRRL